MNFTTAAITSRVGARRRRANRGGNDIKGPLDELLPLGKGQGAKLDQRQTVLVHHIDSSWLRGKVHGAVDDDTHAFEHLVAFVQLAPRNGAVQQNDAVKLFAIDHLGELCRRSKNRHRQGQAFRGVTFGDNQALDDIRHIGGVHQGDEAAGVGTISQECCPNG